ncbi:hypothetical protein V6N12_031229 [Hibiscus sabdariffa]|uniref:Uncharacterized protein n=1 Tax=Hibiscus sabdariffa TaxID=183260 RepID=A0ABR2E8E7_9ROSI
MTDNLRNQITSFRQEDDEAMHEAWERCRDPFRLCLMHGLPKWTQVSIFYNFVNTPTRMMLDASANGTLLDKPPREGLEILEKLAQNDYQHPISQRGNMRRGTTQLDSSDTILAQILALTNMVKNIITRRGHISPPKGRKRSGRFNARLGAVLKQFQVDDIQNPPGQQLWHRLGQIWQAIFRQHRGQEISCMADLSRIRHISCQPRFTCPSRRFPAQAEDFLPSQGSKLSRQESKSVTCRDPCRGRPGQEIQSGVRLDQHIFLSISVQRACQFEAEKIAKVGSQAHAQGR